MLDSLIRSARIMRTSILFRRKDMGFLASLIIGLIVGAIAKALMPGKDPGGIIVTKLLGIAGAMVAVMPLAGMNRNSQQASSLQLWARCCCSTSIE